MRIEHLAVWARDIDTLAAFYARYFGAHRSARYTNARTGFSSYFMSFEDGARLEIMQRPEVAPRADHPYVMGYAHLAIAVGSEAAVDALSAQLAADGYTHVDGPRRTGDGYYEAVILDPDGNRIEITV
jgi:lactoylglutathione lyase